LKSFFGAAPAGANEKARASAAADRDLENLRTIGELLVRAGGAPDVVSRGFA
jgi:hypothetical protein